MNHRTLRIRIGLFHMLIFVGAFLSRLAFAQEPQRAKHGPTGIEDARGDAYGDPLPPGALARMGTFRDYIGDGSSRIIFSPDGQFVTASSAFIRPRLRLWSPATGRVVREFQELDRLGMGAGYVAISSDGSRIAVAGYDVVWVGSIATGQRIRVFAGYEYIEGIALSPDGKVLLVRDQGHLSFWDVVTGAQTHWPSLAGYRPITFTHYFDVAGLRQSGGTSSLRFGVSGREIRSDRPRRRYSGIPIPLAISPDHKIMASYGRYNTIRLWNLATGLPTRSVPRYRVPPGLIIENMEHQLEFSPDGKLLALGDTLTSLSLWDVATGRLYRRFDGVEIEMGFAFAPDGKRVVTGGHYFRYWDIARGQEIHRYPSRAPVAAVAFTPDGKTVVTAAGLALHLWDTATGREIPRFQGRHQSRNLLYPMDWRGQEVRSLGGRQPKIGAMAIAPDGKILVSGAEDGSLWQWDLSTGREIRQVQGLKGAIESIAFAPDGKTFGIADRRGIYLMDSSSGKEIRRFPGPSKGFIKNLAFAPDGSTVASAHDHGLSLWKLSTNKLWKKLAHPAGSWSVAFAPDSKTLATGDAFGVIRVWNVETGEFVSIFARTVKRDVESPRLYSLAFLPNGKTLVSAGDDHFVTLWDLATGQERRRLTGHAARVNSLAIAPNGKTLASGSDDGTALIWGLTTAGPDIRAIAP
jgi:WD40 repeat protein